MNGSKTTTAVGCRRAENIRFCLLLLGCRRRKQATHSLCYGRKDQAISVTEISWSIRYRKFVFQPPTAHLKHQKTAGDRILRVKLWFVIFFMEKWIMKQKDFQFASVEDQINGTSWICGIWDRSLRLELRSGFVQRCMAGCTLIHAGLIMFVVLSTSRVPATNDGSRSKSNINSFGIFLTCGYCQQPERTVWNANRLSWRSVWPSLHYCLLT